MKIKAIILLTTLTVFASSCILKVKTIKPGEVGVKSKFGKIQSKISLPGYKLVFLGTKMVQVDTRVNSIRTSQSTRTKDGVLLSTHVDVLYHINPEKAHLLIQKYNQESTYVTKARYDYRADEFKTVKKEANKKEYISPKEYTKLLENWIEVASSNVICKTNSFEENNLNREGLALSIKSQIESSIIDDIIIIDQVLVNDLTVNPEVLAEIDKQSKLTKQLSIVDLEIELSRKQIELSKIKGENESEYNKAIQASLTTEVFRKKELDVEAKKIESYNAIKENATTIIIKEISN